MTESKIADLRRVWESDRKNRWTFVKIHPEPKLMEAGHKVILVIVEHLVGNSCKYTLLRYSRPSRDGEWTVRAVIPTSPTIDRCLTAVDQEFSELNPMID